MNVAKLIQCVSHVKNNMKDKDWDFRFVDNGHKRCFVGECIAKGFLNKSEYVSDCFGISKEKLLWLFPPTGDYFNESYGQEMRDITRERVCSRVMKFVSWKLAHEHRWNQWEYRQFGKQVTNKRGVCV